MAVTSTWLLSLVTVATGTAHKTMQYSSEAAARFAMARYAANGFECELKRQDSVRADPTRFRHKRKVLKDKTVLHDISLPRKASRPENDRFYKMADEIGGNDTDPAKLTRASSKDLSASWSNSKAKVLRRGEADKAPPGRDVSAMEPDYQLSRLRHNAEVQFRKLQKAIDRNEVHRTMKLLAVLNETQARINLLNDQIQRVNR